MQFKRNFEFTPNSSSAFLFGPRMTGKTTILSSLKVDAYFDLLDPELELGYRSNPKLFWEQLAALKPAAKIVVDEIQRVPELLNYIQMAMDRFGQVFLLSGSSARKLRRGGANLLGGRALDLRLHPLTAGEIGGTFRLEDALHYGTLPRVASLLGDGQKEQAIEYLRSYVTIYIKEEVQAEALTRNIGPFQRFLAVAAQSNAQVIEVVNISRDCAVPASSVKEFFQILEDTLIGTFLWPFDRSERKKARPKFYFFDTGVVRALQNRLVDPPTPEEKGFLFETWFFGELRRLRDYLRKPHEFGFFRERNHEIDLIISGSHGPLLAMEWKSGKVALDASAMRAFRARFPGVELIVASLADERPRIMDGIRVLPWREALDVYQNL